MSRRDSLPRSFLLIFKLQAIGQRHRFIILLASTRSWISSFMAMLDSPCSVSRGRAPLVISRRVARSCQRRSCWCVSAARLLRSGRESCFSHHHKRERLSRTFSNQVRSFRLSSGSGWISFSVKQYIPAGKVSFLCGKSCGKSPGFRSHQKPPRFNFELRHRREVMIVG